MTEPLAPDAIVGTPLNLTSPTNPTVLAIQDDPASPDANWLTTTDPSGSSGLTDGPDYATSVNASTPTGFTGQLTNPANAVGSTEGTFASTTHPTQNADYGNFYQWDANAFAAIPSNATITGLSLAARQTVSNNNRSDQFYRLDSALNTAISAEFQLDATNSVSADVLNSFSVLPTRAQLVSGTFGVRVRTRRTASQTVTFNLDWLHITVTYSIPTVTKNTEVRVSFPSPSANLETG